MVTFRTYLPVALVLIQNAVSANRRATSGSLLLFAVGIIGVGGGSTYIGIVSDFALETHGYRSFHVAFTALVPAIFIAAAAFLNASRRLWLRDRAARVARS